MILLLTTLMLCMPVANTQTVFIEMDSAPTRTWMAFDPVYVRVAIRNESDQRLEVFPSIFLTTFYTSERGHYTYNFPITEGYNPSTITRPIPPGQKLYVNYRTLEAPPPGQLENPFWEQRTWGSITAHVRDFPNKYYPLLADSSTSPMILNSIRLKRPDSEMRFLTSLFTEAASRVPNSGIPNPSKPGRKVPRRELTEYPIIPPDEPSLASFGISIYHQDLSARLLEYEEKLSQGTLRDAVFLTNRLLKLVREPDEVKQQEIVDALVEWFDTLPEVQREILAMNLATWMYSQNYDTHAFHHLFHECVLRSPKEYIQEKNHYYLTTRYQLKHRDSYQTYLKQREQGQPTKPIEPQPQREPKIQEEKKQVQLSSEGDPFQD